MMSQLELGKPEENRKPEKRVNGIFWILLLNLGIYVADHFFQVLITFSCQFFLLYSLDEISMKDAALGERRMIRWYMSAGYSSIIYLDSGDL